MSYTSIEEALVQPYYDTFVNVISPAVPLATKADNEIFNPPPADVWAAVFFLPAETIPATIGLNGYNQDTGLLQVDYNTPVGDGTSQMRAFVEAMYALYKLGTIFTAQDGQKVHITSFARSPTREVDGYSRVSISIFYRAFIDR